MVPLLAALVCPGSLLKLEPDLAACSARGRGRLQLSVLSRDWLCGCEPRDWHSMRLQRQRRGPPP